MLRSVVIFVIIFIGASKAQYPEYDESLCEGLAEDAIIGLPDECDNYYYCYEGIAYLDECNNVCEGCKFDTEINDCNYAENVPQCAADEVVTDPPVTAPPQTQAPVTTQAPQTTTSPGTIPDDITCPDNDVIFLASANCSEYYVCAMGRKITMFCLEGLVWNDEDQRCDHPIYSARCSGLDKGSNNSIKCNRHGFYTTAYPYDCEKFVFCSEGIPMVNKKIIGNPLNFKNYFF
jgi:hypothetical protein